VSLENGHNPDVKHVCMTWEEISFLHRPLFLYVTSGIMQIVTTTLLFRTCGFRSYELREFHYWYCPGPAQSNLDPIIFLHGITPGWLGYAKLVFALGKGRPIFLIDLEGIRIKSMSFRMPNPEYFSRTMKQILKRHRYDTASIVGHSFGTITAGWIIKHNPEIVSHVTLIDPVSLLLCLPDVAFAFVYRKPSTATEWIIYFFASKELTISNTLHRHFSWYRNVLWFDEIPSSVGVVVAIAGCDEVANAASLIEYSQNWQNIRMESSKTESRASPVQIVHWPTFSHGQVLLDSSAQQDVADAMHKNEKKVA